MSLQLGGKEEIFLVYIGQQQYTILKVQIVFEPEDHDSVGIYQYNREQFLEKKKGKDWDIPCLPVLSGDMEVF